MRKCDYCDNNTSNPRFCSRSCAAKKTNIESPKRKLTKICSKCENTIDNSRTTFCSQHLKEHNDKLKSRCPDTKLEDYWNKSSVKDKHPSWKNSHIRALNRSWNKELIKLPCANCGYKKHVELCHIKAVSEFDGSTLLSEVNSSDNVIQLCPNCHWEFDHGHLILSNSN